jgi:glycosyltransferase involved in cell wall biosynthesis
LRIAVIANQIDPNRVALFERVQSTDGVELLVVYETVIESNRQWRVARNVPYPNVLLRSLTIDLHRLGTDAYVHLPLRPLEPLLSFGPDVVVGAGGGTWSSPANILAFLSRRRHGWTFLPWWGSLARDRPTLARRLGEPWIRHFLSRSDLCLAYGTRATTELMRLGVAKTKIRCIPNAVPSNGGLVANQRPHRPLRYLFVGQLIPRKGVSELLTAFSGLSEGELVIAGDGPLRGLVERAVATDPRITYVGHLERDSLQELYASTDVLMLPSRYEVWGLVINEAIQHGAAVIATKSVGATDDLLAPQVNGYVTQSADAAELGDAMRRIAAWDRERWLAAESKDAEITSRWTIEAAANAFVDACRASLERS